MARDHTAKPVKEETPVYLEREVTLSLINQKLNAVLENQEIIKEALKVPTPEQD